MCACSAHIWVCVLMVVEELQGRCMELAMFDVKRAVRACAACWIFECEPVKQVAVGACAEICCASASAATMAKGRKKAPSIFIFLNVHINYTC